MAIVSDNLSFERYFLQKMQVRRIVRLPPPHAMYGDEGGRDSDDECKRKFVSDRACFFVCASAPLFQQVDDPPYLTVGTEVSAKYKGAFCEAKVRKVVRNIKCKVAYKQQGLGSGVVSDDQIKGALRVGATVEVKHPERKEYVEATLTKIQDCSQYTVVFDDGDITTLRRSALCLKSGRHFNESETLDQLPLTHPEHFGNPVIGGRRGRR